MNQVESKALCKINYLLLDVHLSASAQRMAPGWRGHVSQ